ncbi:DUF3344 domain-containing protein [Methanobrevibacter sp.]|uniref:DUF3344 domain-containing protein n=1 Tax=Methanobrevibacter sp. TaxID=66852 RepID=UPI0038641058
MMNRKVLLISCLIFVMFISVGVAFAEDANSTSLTIDSDYDAPDAYEKLASSHQEVLGEDRVTSDDIPTVDSGTVSGGVDVVTTHPWGPSDAVNGNHGNLVYDIPSKATDIKLAHVYVNVYSGSAQPTYGSVANISIKTDNGYLNKTEMLKYDAGKTDGTLYIVNDHITKVYSDYMIFYNITDLVQGLNGTSIAIKVDSLPMQGKSFDGRIKLISLILAYDDGDSDTIDYWINAGQAWTDQITQTHFDSDGVEAVGNTRATLTNIGLSSNDALYEINENPLFFDEEKEDEYIDGPYYQYHKWDVTDYIGEDITISFIASKSGWGSFKEVLSVLIVDHNFTDENSINGTDVDFRTEYSTSTEPTICIYAGTTNTISAKVLTNKGDTYTVKLFVDGNQVDEQKVSLNKVKTIYLTDSTIRPVNENSVYGKENEIVNYTVKIYNKDGKELNSSSHLIPVLYNGYLGNDLAYPCGEYELFFSETITGDIKIDTKDEDTYLERTDLTRTDVWSVTLPGNSDLVKAYIYVPYNYFIPNYHLLINDSVPEDKNMFNVTFNGKKIDNDNIKFYRDQSNLGNYAEYGYGLLVYDVTDLIKTGENTFILNKKDTYPAVSPSTLIYLYNTTSSSTLKEIYLSNGVDLLENSYNLAKRAVKSDVTVNLNPELVEDARLYVFAAGAQEGNGNIKFNGKEFTNVWKGTSHTTDLYEVNVKKFIDEVNTVSFISTGSTIQALQQIIVLTKNIQTSVDVITTKEGDNVFAGIKNDINITIKNTRNGKFNVTLFADGKYVNSTEITLNGNSKSLILSDPTIRPITENLGYGEENDKVNYTVKIFDSTGKQIYSYSNSMPIIYNGYLGKDFEYPGENNNLFFKGTITGDIVINTTGSYLSSTKTERTDVWNVNLPGNSNFVKAYIYVPYSFFSASGSNEDKNMFSVVFNGVKVAPVGFYRDQPNYGVYVKNGQGLLVYDVSSLIKQGKNTFTLNKKTGIIVYPSTLIYLYNTVGTSVSKNVYISNGADLLSADKIDGLNQVKSDSSISADLTNMIDARLYVFAASAQKDEGNVIFNGKEFANVWDGETFSSDVFSSDVTDSIKTSNSISFVSTGDEILALQQILVTSFKKIDTSISANKVNTAYLSGTKLIVTLKDSKGNPLSNKKVSIKLNGKPYDRVTDANGQVKLDVTSALGAYTASLTFLGDEKYTKSTSSVSVVVKKATPKFTAAKKTFKAKTKTKKYTITFKTNTGKPMKKVKLTLKIKGKTYKATTNANGKATFKITKFTKKGKFTATIKYSGNKYYNAASKKVKITIKK